jgi:hypothetical protein
MNAPFRTPRPEWEAEVVREFARALRQVREEETELMRLSLYKLELILDGLRELRRDLPNLWR